MEAKNQPMVGLTLVLVLTISLTGAAQQRGQDIESRAHTRALANGLTIVVIERPGTGSFGGMLACKAGTADDPPGGAGIAHLVEHFLAGPTLELIGPPKALMRDLTQEYEKTGGVDSARSKALEAEIAAARKGRQQWNIGTVQDFVFYGVTNHPAAGLDRFLQAEAETMDAVPSGSIETQRQVLIDEITRTIAKDVSNQTANPNLTTAFAGHPYGAPIGGVPPDAQPLTLAIARHQVALGDWKAVLKAREAYRTVSAPEVLAFARTYFTPEDRTVVTLLAVPR